MNINIAPKTDTIIKIIYMPVVVELIFLLRKAVKETDRGINNILFKNTE